MQFKVRSKRDTKPTYAKAQAYKLLKRDDVQAYITYLQSKAGEVTRGVMELEEIQEFWSQTIRSNCYHMRDRLRASELLAKSKGSVHGMVGGAYGSIWVQSG